MGQNFLNLHRTQWNINFVKLCIKHFKNKGSPPLLFFWNGSVLHFRFYKARRQATHAAIAPNSNAMNIPAKRSSEVILSEICQEADNLLGAGQTAMIANKS